MHALNAYRQQRTLGWTKVDLVLALQSKTMERIESGLAALQRGDHNEAAALFARAQLGVHGLLCGLNLSQGELAQNQQRLYDYAIRCLRSADPTMVGSALDVLRTLYQGYLAIRDEAAILEQTSACGAVQNQGLVRKTA